ncbi:MAG: DNA polymerase II large subunit [Thermoplasmata archaeon]|nr:DNA polymerase II large subunit [Thermoplasmata archaeon]
MSIPACSEATSRYFELLKEEADKCYSIARKARAKGLDPSTDVEIPMADDLASRVEHLLSDWGTEGIAEKIRELSKKHNREEVSILIAKEIATLPSRTKEEAIDRAIRVGVAVLTEGILVAPLEGIAGVKIRENNDGSQYLTVYFAGPIRSAGGTGQAMSVLIADIVRRQLGISKYIPIEGEVQRLKEEIPLYRICQHLQYTPTNDEIDLIVRNLPVCIDGEGTEETEITGYRDLPRIETNRIRGGACLVIAEGLCLKAPKLQKHVKKLGIDGWEFLDEYLKKKGSAVESSNGGIAPSEKFLKDIVGGRPVLSHPSRIGGFRLRYGRSRATGLAAVGLNPATMQILGGYIAVGTQIKLERPGKAGAVTPCETIEGPIVLLDNGDLVQIHELSEANRLKARVKEIVDVGEILISFGEFAENNHPLVPVGLTIEEYRAMLNEKAEELPKNWSDTSFEKAVEISKKYDLPLHPKFNLFWSDLSIDKVKKLRDHILKTGKYSKTLTIDNDPEIKSILERLGALHRVRDEKLRIGAYAKAMIFVLGIESDDKGQLSSEKTMDDGCSNILEALSKLCGIGIAPRAVTRIGARMARPEKAKERKMSPPPHILFPIGFEGGSQRLLNEAAMKGDVNVTIGERRCPVCGNVTFSSLCICGSHTLARKTESVVTLHLKELLDNARKNVGLRSLPDIKAVQGMISKEKTPEPLEKGILRAKHEVFVFKDGTTRIDATDVPLTHFRPAEIGLSVEEARSLGYDRDALGNELTDAGQICELKVQDIIVPASCAKYLVNTAKFTDELLSKLYEVQPYYKVTKQKDLVGHLAIGLAPHTSGGVLARIIGFSKAKAGYAHPYFHSAKRRNCDGDEDSIILLMDALINFSRSFLPEKRGGLMDAPLVLTTRIDPDEIDKEAHNLDFRWEYPVELYNAAREYKSCRSVEGLMDLAGGRIGTVLQYEGFGYTHEVLRIDDGPLSSSYTASSSMGNNIDAQLEIAAKIRAVDARDVAHRVIVRHLLPDLVGSLRKFSAQQLRCTKCNTKYRRMPLRGKCSCGNTLILTVSAGSVSKYLEKAKEIADKYDVPKYTRQRIELVETSINSIFESDRVKDSSLDDFF